MTLYNLRQFVCLCDESSTIPPLGREYSDLARTAEIWAEVGKPENYRAELSPDESQLVISHENPKTKDDDIQAIQARHSEMGRNLTLLNWTYSYFDDGKLKESLTLEAAATEAKALDLEDLFATGYDHIELAHQRQSAVAGVAAILLLENAEAHIEWATEACARAAMTPEVPQQFFTRSAKLMHHPVLYATKGLGALFTVVRATHRPFVAFFYGQAVRSIPWFEEPDEVCQLRHIFHVASNVPVPKALIRRDGQTYCRSVLGL